LKGILVGVLIHMVWVYISNFIKLQTKIYNPYRAKIIFNKQADLFRTKANTYV